MKKLLISLAFVIVFACAFVLCASAAEYTVQGDADNAESNSYSTVAGAFAAANDGDTIVIKKDVTEAIDFGKSITYIIDGAYTWKATTANSAEGKNVSVLARNGNAVLKTNEEYWFYRYGTGANRQSITTTTFTMGSADSSSTLTFDTTASAGLFHQEGFKEWNFKNGVIVSGTSFTKNDRYFIYATTVNIYDGAKFYGNSILGYRTMFNCTTLNIYGGEIYGNSLSDYGFTSAKTVNMYGGSIYNNYFNFTNTGYAQGIFNQATVNMYDGEIYGNYIKRVQANQSVIYGTKLVADSKVHDNYIYSAWNDSADTAISATRNEATGLFELVNLNSSYLISDASKLTGTTTLFAYSVTFKNTDGSIIDAFMIKEDGSVLNAYSGATEFGVPQGYDVWVSNKTDSCTNGVTPESTAQATYYGVNHQLGENAVIVYPNGFGKTGKKINACLTEGCEHFLLVEDNLNAIITAIGYSVKLDTSNGYGISGGYSIDYTALRNYESANGVKIELGVFMLNVDGNDDFSSFFTNGKFNYSKKCLNIKLDSSSPYKTIDFKITNFTEALLDLDLIISAYATVISGDEASPTYTTEFVQHETTKTVTTVEKDDASLHTVSCNSLNA